MTSPYVNQINIKQTFGQLGGVTTSFFMYNGACQVTAFWYVVTKLQQDIWGGPQLLCDDAIHTFLYITSYQHQEVPTENRHARLKSQTGTRSHRET